MVTFGATPIGGSDPGSFKIATDGCSRQPLAPNSHCEIGVEFAPLAGASGTQSATLSLSYTCGAHPGNASANLSA